jgi:hypothetical protein
MAPRTNLFEASNQWVNRPRDERFANIAALIAATKAHAATAEEISLQRSDLQVVNTPKGIALSRGHAQAQLTYYAFGQLARLAGAPANYLRELPSELATDCLRSGLDRAMIKGEERNLNLLLHKNGSLIARAITTERYDRVWNWMVAEQVQKRLIERGWRTPPAMPSSHARPEDCRPATQEDLSPHTNVRLGQMIAPAGLYASDHDMFLFVVNDREGLEENGSAYARGAFIQNSEVGDCALKFTTFLYDYVCQNHIVWGAREVNRVSVRHMKSAHLDSGNTLYNAVLGWRTKLAQLPAATTLSEQIRAARVKVLGSSDDEVVDNTYTWAKGRNLNRLTKTVLTDAFNTAERTPRYGNPRTVWGDGQRADRGLAVLGLRRRAQRAGHAGRTPDGNGVLVC